MADGNKFITDAKLLIALWENCAANVKRSNIIDCIENGANVNVRFPNNCNNTPLHIAVIKGDRKVVNILLRYGAKANVANDEGKTALDFAKELPEYSDIAEILEARVEPAAEKAGTPVDGELTSAAVCRYKKRKGTAGVRGQLYETKLLTLIYLRAFRCRDLTQFYLGTNVDEIGDMDDVCLRFKTINHDYIIFLQAKHKNDTVKGRVGIENLWRTSGDFSLHKYFSSYRKIRDKFNPNSDDELFRGRYDEMKRFYVMYTTLKDDIECDRKKTPINDEVSGLLATGEHQNIFQLKYDEQYMNLLTKALLIERIKDMGKKLFKLIQDNEQDMMLSDENIRSFHVMLAQKVIKVSEVNATGRRTGTFREEFFSSNEEILIALRGALYKEATKNKNLSYEEIYTSVINISLHPYKEPISELIGILTYDTYTNTLKLNDEGDEKISTLQSLLKPIQVPQSVFNEAFEIAGLRKLCSLTFNLPAAFGNLDMTLNKKKSERRLDYLANKIVDVIKESADAEGNVVIHKRMYATNKWLTAGDLAVNGGIAGAVGNLLISDDKKKLKFNLDDDTLNENAKMLLLRLKERILDLHRYRFVADSEVFPRISFYATDYEKMFVTDFLDNLYFYTCQAKEDQLEEIGSRELQTHECSDSFSKAESRIRSNALFLKVHNEIQIWWMTEQTAPYLTRNTFAYIYRDLSNKGLLTFLNFIYLKEIYNASLEFNPEAIEVLSLSGRDTCDAKMIVIHTEVHMLTCHKLAQYFKGAEDYIFLDIHYICQMSPNCLKIIIDELAETNIDNVVIISEDVSKYNDVIRACGARKIILVTSNFVPSDEYITVRDDRINLTDLTDASQRKVLQNQFTFQGTEVTFAEVFDENTKYLINAKVLEKIINKEYISVGQTLALSTYEEIKHYYVPRSLQRNKRSRDYTNETSELDFYLPSSSESEDFNTWSSEEHLGSDKTFSPITLIDHHAISKGKPKKETYDILLIIDAPGMGKSTLLTHLSLQTKRQYPKIWIQRINLIDHTKQFHEWHEKKIKVNSVEALKFVCKIVMSKESSLSNDPISDGNNINIWFEIVNDEIKLINREKQRTLRALELDIFLNCFNKGRIVFLFDGFDEVCPHYKTEVTQLLEHLARRSPVRDESAEDYTHTCSEKCVWITSRPYNDLRETLEKKFGESYTIQPFSYKDIRVFLDKYMRRNLDINTLTSNQLRNINGFFEYMKRFNIYYDGSAKDVALVCIPLHSVYVAAMEYFKSEIKRSHVIEDNLIYVRDWDIEISKLAAWRKHLNNYERFNDVITLSGVPLHVYIAIHYFQSQVKGPLLTNTEEFIKQWDLDMNACAFYDRFIETKLKTIRFEEKNRMDIYNPDVKMTYEKEKKEFLDKHKKLAFYSVGSKTGFTNDELDEVKEIIRKMEIGEEKTGLVDRVVDGEPRFVHYTFAEYFAVEYILDYLKSSELDKQERMLDYILENMVFRATNGILNLFELKIKYDSVLVNAMSTAHLSHCILETLIEQSNVEYPDNVYDDFIGNPEDLTATALDNVVRRGMIHFATFLIDVVINIIDETNFTDTMRLIEKGTFFERLIVSNKDELVGKILDCIRRFDASKIDDLFPYSLFEARIHSRTTNEEFIDAYHQKIFEKLCLRLLPSRNRHMSS